LSEWLKVIPTVKQQNKTNNKSTNLDITLSLRFMIAAGMTITANKAREASNQKYLPDTTLLPNSLFTTNTV
jgi:hypothetical protein